MNRYLRFQEEYICHLSAASQREITLKTLKIVFGATKSNTALFVLTAKLDWFTQIQNPKMNIFNPNCVKELCERIWQKKLSLFPDSRWSNFVTSLLIIEDLSKSFHWNHQWNSSESINTGESAQTFASGNSVKRLSVYRSPPDFENWCVHLKICTKDSFDTRQMVIEVYLKRLDLLSFFIHFLQKNVFFEWR